MYRKKFIESLILFCVGLLLVKSKKVILVKFKNCESVVGYVYIV